MAKTKKINAILPAGIACWPKLNEVDVFTPKKGEPKRRYTINLKFNDDDHRKVDAWLRKCAKEFGDDVGANTNSPWKKDKKSGDITLFAFSGEKFKPPVFDAKNRRLPANVVVGGGSKVRLDVNANPYDGFGGGINLYINAVQVLELTQGGQSRFEEAEGYAHDGKEESAGSFDEHTSSNDEDMDDDIPF